MTQGWNCDVKMQLDTEQLHLLILQGKGSPLAWAAPHFLTFNKQFLKNFHLN